MFDLTEMKRLDIQDKNKASEAIRCFVWHRVFGHDRESAIMEIEPLFRDLDCEQELIFKDLLYQWTLSMIIVHIEIYNNSTNSPTDFFVENRNGKPYLRYPRQEILKKTSLMH